MFGGDSKNVLARDCPQGMMQVMSRLSSAMSWDGGLGGNIQSCTCVTSRSQGLSTVSVFLHTQEEGNAVFIKESRVDEDAVISDYE